MYVRLMMIGFFEGIDSERGIAWRVADSPTLRQFLQLGRHTACCAHAIGRGTVVASQHIAI
jgi:transposase